MTLKDFYITYTNALVSLVPRFDDTSPKLLALWNKTFSGQLKKDALNTTDKKTLVDEWMKRAARYKDGDPFPEFVYLLHDVLPGETKEIERITVLGGFEIVKIATWPKKLETYIKNVKTGETVLWRTNE